MAKQDKATVSHFCQICQKVRIGEYSHSDEYFHYYVCNQADTAGISHTFYVQTLLGKTMEVTRNTAGVIVVGKVAETVYKKFEETAKEKAKATIDSLSVHDLADEKKNVIAEHATEAIAGAGKEHVASSIAEEATHSVVTESKVHVATGIIGKIIDLLT